MDLTYISLCNNQTYEFTILVKRPSDCAHPCVYTGKATGWHIKRLIEIQNIWNDSTTPVVISHADGTLGKQMRLKEICREYQRAHSLPETKIKSRPRMSCTIL